MSVTSFMVTGVLVSLLSPLVALVALVRAACSTLRKRLGARLL